MRKHHLVMLIAAALLLSLPPLLAPRPAHAYLVKTNARPIAPAIAFATAYNSYLLVWAEDRGAGTGLDLYAARMTSSGIVQGYEVPVVVEPGNQSDPTVVYSEQANQFVLVYTDDRGASFGGTPTPGLPNPGTPIPPGPGTPSPVTPPPPPLVYGGPSGSPAAGLPRYDVPAYDASAHGLPAYDFVQAGPISPDQPTPPPPGPTMTPGTNPPPPPGGTPGSRDLYLMFIAVNGQRASASFPIVTSPADDTYPDMAYMWRGRSDGLGDRIAVVWREVTGVESAIKAFEIVPFGRFFDPYDRADTVVAGGDLSRPSVAAEINTGEYLVVWSQTPTDDPARDLFARRLNANAFPYRPTIRLVTAKAPLDDVYPSVGSLYGFGGYLLAWERRDGANPPDIQTRQLNTNGIPYRNVNALAGGPAFSFSPDVASTLRTSSLVVWIDRNAASDHSIMVAEVTRDGRRIGPERLVVQGGAGPAAVTPVGPPGFPTLPPPPPTP